MPHIVQWTALGLCGAMALALAVAAPIVAATEDRSFVKTGPIELQGTYESIESADRNEDGSVNFEVAGIADLYEYNYQQPLRYTVTLDADGEFVTDVEPIEQSTMGYVAELSLFEGKSYKEIASLTQLGTDAELSATRTNTALREMILECFDAMEEVRNG